MDEIDCLQVENIKLKNNIIAYSKSSLNNNVGEKKVEKNSNTLLHSSKQEYYHYVNALGLS